MIPLTFRNSDPHHDIESTAGHKERRGTDRIVEHVRHMLDDHSTIIQVQLENHEKNMSALRDDTKAEVSEIRKDLRHQSQTTIEAIEKIIISREQAQESKLSERLGCIDSMQTTIGEHHEAIGSLKTNVENILTKQIKRDAESWTAGKKLVVAGVLSAIVGAGVGYLSKFLFP
jgi:SMC interacting uncharacterized protein involved in chromosome segregation